jgi:hypothetical protein
MLGCCHLIAVVSLAMLQMAMGAVSGAAGPPSEEDLAAVEERGRMIARYVEARTRATRKLKEFPNIPALHDGMLVRMGKGEWRVVFLKEPPKNDPRMRVPLIMVEILYDPQSGAVGSPRRMIPPREASATTVSHYRALQTVESAAETQLGAAGAHEGVVYREKNGRFTVYLVSGDTPDGSVRLGDDYLGSVASTGRRLLSIEPLHSSPAVDVPLTGMADGEPTLHAHELGELPTATDVALLILHPSVAPLLVLTPHFMYRIDAEGRITYLGLNPVSSRRQDDEEMPGRSKAGL